MKYLDQAFELATRHNAAVLGNIIGTPLSQRDVADLQVTGQDLVSKHAEFRAALADIGESPLLMPIVHNIYSSL